MMRFFLVVVLAFTLGGAVTAETSVPASKGEMALSFVPVVKKTTPAVVNIYAKRIVQTQQGAFANDPFFSDFFKSFGQPTQRVQNSLGSGVVLSRDGLVVSNYHVIEGASDIRVVLNDRREFDAKVLLADEQSDLAVLKIEGVNDLPALSLRPSDGVEVGELVLAIGNPFGVGQTVSSGIISGLARSGGAVGNARAYFIQTDAPINPGNSGGALVDMNGDLVGINTSILTRSGGSNGIGFAIPADLVASFLVQAQAGNDHFRRPWAGVVGQLVDAALAQQFGLDRPEGMALVDVHPASPFAKAGLRVGDVLLSINGHSVNGPAEMLYHMSVLGVGSDAEVDYLRGGKRLAARIAMIEAPESPARNTLKLDNKGPLQGLTLSRINPAIIAEIGLPVNASGVVVEAVDGIARQLGFQPGDILVSVNGAAIDTPSDARDANSENTRRWDITIERGGQQLSMRFRL